MTFAWFAVLLALAAAIATNLFWLIKRSANAAATARLQEQLAQKTELADEWRGRHEKLEAEKSTWIEQQHGLKAETVRLQTRLHEQEKSFAEKAKTLTEAEQKLTDVFKSLSSEALRANNASFLELAKENLSKHQSEAKTDLEARQKAIDALVNPLLKSLERVDQTTQNLEKERLTAYTNLLKEVQTLQSTGLKLQTETGHLVNALKAPQVRGRWGEMTLQRVAELAGMVEHCDFYQQEQKNSDDGALRPDMIVRLPGGKSIVVDAKTPLAAYIQALEATSEDDRTRFLQDHARQLQTHIRQLGQKNYWEQFEATPDFVVMFIPGESFLHAALQQNPGLIEEGIQKSVFLASPTTLITLLKSVSFGWRQEQLTQNAAEICAHGKDLYERLASLAKHFDDLGRALKNSSTAYNNAVGALELRVLPQARKFEGLGIKPKDGIPHLKLLDVPVRDLQAPELVTLTENTESILENKT